MRIFPAALILLAALAAAVPVTAQTSAFTEIEPGDLVTGRTPALSTGGADPVVIPFLGLDGSLVTFSVKADAGSFPLLTILRPDRTLLPLVSLNEVLGIEGSYVDSLGARKSDRRDSIDDA